MEQDNKGLQQGKLMKTNMLNEVTKLFTSSLQQCAFHTYSGCSKCHVF